MTAGRQNEGGDWVRIARIVKTQGRTGELAAEMETDLPGRFEQLQRVFLARPGAPAAPFGLKGHWFHKGRVILALEGIGDLNAAEAWVGAEVVLPREERAQLPEGRWYLSDLEGCRVMTRGIEAGRLTWVEEMPGGSQMLHVTAESGQEVLVPFVQEWIEKVDVEGGVIEMQLPEGLLEVNAPAAGEGNSGAAAAPRRERRRRASGSDDSRQS